MSYITASKLNDYLQCPHRIWRDIHGSQDEKISETNPFLNMLWEKGIKHEEKIVKEMGNFIDLSQGSIEDRFQMTIDAMKKGEALIYQGIIKHKYLLGIPDLLKRMPDGFYMPIDIKSGSGFEESVEDDAEEGKPKKHYAVQLCLYNEILNRLGFANHSYGIIIDIHSKEIKYNLSDARGKRQKDSWQDFYEKIKEEIRLLMQNQLRNAPALSSLCKLCPWVISCKNWCVNNKDLTNIFYIGRGIRDKLHKDLMIQNTDDFMKIDVSSIMDRKEKEKKSGNKDFLSGIGEDTLKKAIDRAKILYQTKLPVAYEKLSFLEVEYELFFDIEDDPTQDFVYMHGVYERKFCKREYSENKYSQERFINFTAKEISKEAEKEAWHNFWKYIFSLPQTQNGFAIYHYSLHEKTIYKKLQKRYPDVISSKALGSFFERPNVIDLYTDIVLKKTDWPVGSYSIKEIATYLNFKWRDQTPSGALSIQWFNEYLKTKDEAILTRICEYNEDDCKATMVLKDALENLKIQPI